MDQANAYLEDHYWSSYNAKFAVAAAKSAADPAPAGIDDDDEPGGRWTRRCA